MSNIELLKKVNDLYELRAMAAQLSDEITALEDAIKAHMNETGADALTAGDHRVTWKEVVSSRFDTSTFEKDFPDVAVEYTRKTTTRRFLIA